MKCAWNELLGILPHWIRLELKPFENQCLQEIRMRINSPPELSFTGHSQWLTHCVTQPDLDFCIASASQYSPWTATSAAYGYITAPGGHRIGICGEAVVKNHDFCGVRSVSSLCIRVAQDFVGISKHVNCVGKSVLILGAPGWGKTTLLRDVARELAKNETVCVIDERQEIFPQGFKRGTHMDVMMGCPKIQGIEIMLRTMGPSVLVVDEITAQPDCLALVHAFGCGVKLIATAHASSVADYHRKTTYSPLQKAKVFDTFLVLHKDKTFHVEEANCCVNL